MESAVSFAPLRPADFVNFAGRGGAWPAFRGAGQPVFPRGGATPHGFYTCPFNPISLSTNATVLHPSEEGLFVFVKTVLCIFEFSNNWKWDILMWFLLDFRCCC